MAPTPTFRLAIVLSHPVQYYSPWFRWLRSHTELEFKVYYLWDFGVRETKDPQFETTFKWDRDLLSGYEHEFVPNVARDPGTHHFRGLDNPSLTARLAEWKPNAVLLFGYNWLSHLRVIWWGRRQSVPLLFRGDSHLLGRGPLPLPKRWLLQALYAQFSAIIHVGRANRDYFRSLGFPEHRLFLAPHSVDAAAFDPSMDDRLTAARRLRAELGLEGKRIALFAGKFSPAKQPLELLRAFHAVATEEDALVFVGDGALREELTALAAARADRHVRILPFANQSEMPVRYLLADLFVLPSRGFYETWGLAVNEAMHCGLPCLVSDLVGCQRDLVDDGETGWVFPANDPAALPAALARALADVRDASRRERLRAQVAARISRYNYAASSDGLLAALKHLAPTP